MCLDVRLEHIEGQNEDCPFLALAHDRKVSIDNRAKPDD